MTQDIDFALSEYVLSDSDQIRYPDTKVKPALSLEATEYPKLHPEALDEAGNMKQRVLRKAYERHSNRWDYARQVFPASGTAIVPVYHLPGGRREASALGGAVECGLAEVVSESIGCAAELEERKASLRLSVGLLSRIYRCNVTRWNDPDILALNQGIQDILPDAPIEV